MIYITNKGDFRAKLYQKFKLEIVILYFCYEAKATPTVKMSPLAQCN